MYNAPRAASEGLVSSSGHWTALPLKIMLRQPCPHSERAEFRKVKIMETVNDMERKA